MFHSLLSVPLTLSPIPPSLPPLPSFVPFSLSLLSPSLSSPPSSLQIALTQLTLQKLGSITGKPPKEVEEVLRIAKQNFADHVTEKLAVARRQNDQVYHDPIPKLEHLRLTRDWWNGIWTSMYCILCRSLYMYMYKICTCTVLCTCKNAMFFCS